MADSAAVDVALIAKLQGDATLMAILTDGVWFDVAASGKTKFAIVSLATHADDDQFQGTAFEEASYLIKAVIKDASSTSAKTAAARIHTLLQDVPLTITGFTHMVTRRSERIRYTEVDDVDHDIRWQHQGGRYDVWVSP